jgi:hypothetical protein
LCGGEVVGFADVTSQIVKLDGLDLIDVLIIN